MKTYSDRKLLIKIIKWVGKELRKDDQRYLDETGDMHPAYADQAYDLIDHRENLKRSKAKSCEYKRKYVDQIQAEQALESYRKRVLFTNMNFYRCEAHGCFHLGHDRYMPSELILSGSRGVSI